MGFLASLKRHPVKIYKNRSLIQPLWRLYTSTGEARTEALEDLESWVEEKRRSSRLGAKLEAKGFARTFLEDAPWVVDHLRDTPHFGMLQDFTAPKTTRLDYVGVQFSLLMRLKKAHRGLGLVSVGASGRSIKHRGAELSGLEIAQCWALLFNCGHLHRTFATERAFQYALRTDRLQGEFLSQIAPRLQRACRRILRTESQYDFVKALACWRVSTAQMSEALRATLIEVLAAYFEAANDVRHARLAQIYQRLRQISYLYLHGVIGIGFGALDERSLDSIIAHIVEDDGVRLEAFAPTATPLGRFLDAVDRFQFETFFTGDQACTAVLTHLREFRIWWELQRAGGRPFPEVVQRLFSRPEDWPSVPDVGVLPVAMRLEIPMRGTKWISEVAQWRSGGSEWNGATFHLAQAPRDSHATVRILSERRLDPSTLFHMGIQLARHCKRSWEDSNVPPEERQRLWRSIARFGRGAFEYSLAKGLSAEVRPTKGAKKSLGLASISADVVAVTQRLRVFAAGCADEARRTELEEVAAYLDRFATDASIWLVFFGRFSVVDSQRRELHELDGLIARIDAEKIEWHVIEVKGHGVSGARRQLRMLRKNILGEVRIENVPLAVGATSVARWFWPMGRWDHEALAETEASR